MDLINPRPSSSRREGASAARREPSRAKPKLRPFVVGPRGTAVPSKAANARPATRRTKKAPTSDRSLSLTCLIHQEADGYVSRCPELDVASQGDSIEEARANLIEAVELFLECASPSEIKRRVIGRVFITPFEVRVG